MYFAQKVSLSYFSFHLESSERFDPFLPHYNVIDSTVLHHAS